MFQATIETRNNFLIFFANSKQYSSIQNISISYRYFEQQEVALKGPN